MMCLAVHRQQGKGKASVHEPWLLLRVTDTGHIQLFVWQESEGPAWDGGEGGKPPLVQGTYRTKWKKEMKEGQD